MPDDGVTEDDGPSEGDVMAGDRRIARTDSALPDWYVSDAAYRPIPIVWFAGAMLLQVVTQTAVLLLPMFFPPLVAIAVAILATGLIARLTWKRGMATASAAWRLATAAMLAIFLGITILATLI